MPGFKSLSRIAATGLALAAGLLPMAQKPAVAQTNGVWSATAGGSWPTGSNWTSSQVATGVSGSANFTSGITGIQVVTLDGDRTIGFMRLGSSGGGNIFSLQMGTSGTLTLQTSSGSPSIDIQSSRSGIIGLALAGSQGFTKVGAGTLYLGGTNTYSGQTSITAGTLEIKTANALGATGAGNGTVIASGARLRIGATITVNESISINGAGTTGALNFGSSEGGVNVSAATMAGLVTLQSAATIGVSGGSSGIMDRSGAGDAIDNGGFALTIQNSGSLEVKSPISGAGSLTLSGNGQLVLTAANTYTGTTGWTGATGTLFLGNGGTGGSLSTSSAIDITNPSAQFSVNQSDTVTQGVDFSGSAITGNGIFNQIGTGTTILNAANSYNGATNVNAGTLLINGNQTAANGAVTVANGATLGGSGRTGGAVTVNGTLSPGNSPGVLTAASVVLGASSTSLFEINTTSRGTGYDGVDITGLSGLTYGGALSLSFGNGSAFANGTTFDLFSLTGTPSGDFSSVTSTGFYAGTWTLAAGAWSLTTSEQKLTFTPSTGDLVIAVPEPSTFMLLGGLAVGGFLARRRQAARAK